MTKLLHKNWYYCRYFYAVLFRKARKFSIVSALLKKIKNFYIFSSKTFEIPEIV